MKLKSQTKAVLVSGGLDSSVLLWQASKKYAKVYPIYVKCGLLWEKMELYWLKVFIKSLHKESIQSITILKVPMQDLYNGHWSVTGCNVPDHKSSDLSVYLPGRNIILIAKSAIYCAINHIEELTLATLKGNPFPDATRSFFNSFEKVVSKALNSRISIITPYLNYSKDEVIRKGRLLPLDLTFSCIKPAGRYHCGICNKCSERKVAFQRAGIFDKTPYLTPTHTPGV